MNKKALLASVLAGTMLLSGCSLIVKDEAVDAATPVVKVGEHEFTKGEVNAQVTAYLNNMAQYYAQNYGYSIDTTSKEMVADARSYVTDTLVKSAVIEDKIRENNFYDLTEEDQKTIDEECTTYHDLFAGMLGEDAEGTEEEKEASINNMIAAYFGITKSMLEGDAREAKLKNLIVKDVTVDDAAVTAEYESRVAAAKASYETNVGAYGSEVMNGETVYYRPAGYRLVKSILVGFAEEDKNKVSDYTSKAASQAGAANTAKNAVNSMEVDYTALGVAEDAEDKLAALTDMITVTVKDGEEVTTEVADTLPADIDGTLKDNLVAYKTATVLQAWYKDAADAARAAAFANIDAKVDEIVARLDAGEDFTAVQYEVTEDPGMKEGAEFAAAGYPVCAETTSLDAAYVAGAMALAKVGDHSAKIASDNYGYFIVCYAGDVAEGDVPAADVQETIHSELLQAAQDARYDEQIDAWVKDANAKIDLKVLD